MPSCLPSLLTSVPGRNHCYHSASGTAVPHLCGMNKVATYIYYWLRRIIRGIVMVLGVTDMNALALSPFPVIIPCMTEVVFISTVGKLYFFDKQLFYLKLKRIPFYTMIHHLELKGFFCKLIIFRLVSLPPFLTFVGFEGVWDCVGITLAT